MKTIIVAHVNENYTDYFQIFEVEHDYEKPKDMVEAIKASILTWCDTTEAGQDAYDKTEGDFSWGDLALYVGDFFIPGVKSIRAIDEDMDYIYVDHDERLMDKEVP